MNRATVTCLMLAVLLLQTGCLILPVPESQQFYGGRQIIDQNLLDLLVPGETTRADILLEFGEPDIVSVNGNQFAYKWKMAKAVWLAIIGGDYAADVIGGDIPELHLVILEFDEDGVLQRFSSDEFYLNTLGQKLREKNFEWDYSTSKVGTIMVEHAVDPIMGNNAQPGDFNTLMLVEWEDLRTEEGQSPDFLGQAGIWGVDIGEIKSFEPVAEVLKRLFINQVLAMGGNFSDVNPDLVVRGELRRFEIETRTGIFSVGAVCRLNLMVTLEYPESGAAVKTFDYRPEVEGKDDDIHKCVQEAYTACLLQLRDDLFLDLSKLQESRPSQP